ncbi:uncharacterized protein YcnI [Nocardioides sp. J9]|uniref:YcnI family copper-binding membrane protein n=1 Tax=Nocardioides sp. J9 TaxID=935844 RepID=UPI0011A8E14B|nr:YcnI family protein [Nocardioides sp. J9]TWG98222.1 uncharacterized protein YcnI [Nocardioides sp. J9]
MSDVSTSPALSVRSRLARAAVVPAAAAAVLLCAPSAGAHVTVNPSTTSAGAYSVLTFSVGHGCGEAPTTSMTFQVPDGVISVTPTVKAGWSVEKVMEELDEPVDDGHGGHYTERVAAVVFAAEEPLADGYRETFELQLALPDAVGEQLVLPVVQECTRGENAWVQVAAEGADEPEYPAPAFTLTDATGEGHHGGAEAEDALGEADEHAVATAEASASGDGLAWTGLGLGAAGLLAGCAALARSRR